VALVHDGVIRSKGLGGENEPDAGIPKIYRILGGGSAYGYGLPR